MLIHQYLIKPNQITEETFKVENYEKFKYFISNFDKNKDLKMIIINHFFQLITYHNLCLSNFLLIKKINDYIHMVKYMSPYYKKYEFIFEFKSISKIE